MRVAIWLFRFFKLRIMLMAHPVRSVSNIPVVFYAAFYTVMEAVCLLLRILFHKNDWSAEERGLALWDSLSGAFVLRMLKCMDIEIEVAGEENIPPDGPCLLVSNHESILDHLVFGYAVQRGRFVLKSGILAIPVVGWAIKCAAQLPIKRFKGGPAMESIRSGLAEWMNCRVIIYAEGSRKEKRGGMLGRFKTGAARISLEFGMPIVPVAISGTGNILPPGPFCALRRHGRVKVQFGRPIMPNGSAAELTRKVRSQVLKMLVLLESNCGY